MTSQALTKIDVWSAAKVAAILYACIGLIAGLFLAAFSLLGGAMSARHMDGGDMAFVGVIFGVGAIFIMPVVYGVIGAISVALMAAIYNLVARFTGGLRFELSA